MKIQILLGVEDSSYLEHLSQVLARQYADTFEVSACSARDSLLGLLGQRSFDVALLDAGLAAGVPAEGARLCLLLWDGMAALPPELAGWKRLRKYQRISTLTGEILESYAGLFSGSSGLGGSRAHITAVWSPAGGSGKTTVALAYAAQQVAGGRKTVYLDLEQFSSVPAYFPAGGKSISTVFERLDEDVALLMQGIRQTDSGSGIGYYCCPNNYDDMNILTVEDVQLLIESAAQGVDDLVVDLSSLCDGRVRKALALADQVLLVLDGSPASLVRWEQFRGQHNTYGEIAGKLCLVANRGAKLPDAQVTLPYVQTGDPIVVYKTLSAGYFTVPAV